MGNIESRITNIKKYFITAGICWTIAIAALFSWGYYQEMANTLEIAKIEARIHFDKDYALRLWASSHGGVYVPADDRTPPNPKLRHIAERDIQTPSGKKLTLMNPAYMMRQLMEEYDYFYKVKGRVTSLNATSKLNAPNEWERKALEQFELGVEEISELAVIDGAPHLRFIRALKTGIDCLKCHAGQGYREGEVRGGIGITLPLTDLYEAKRSHIMRWGLSLFLVWLAGLGALFHGANKIMQNVKDMGQAHRNIEDHRARFESIFNSMNDGVIFADLDKRIRMINPGFTKLMGYALNEVEGREPGIFFYEPDKYLTTVRESFSPKDDTTGRLFEIRYKRKDGSSFLSETHTEHVTGNNGKVIGYLWIIRDITERIRSRKEMQVNRKRLEIMLELNEFSESEEEEIIRFGLESSALLTGSEIGYILCIFGKKSSDVLYAWSGTRLAKYKAANLQTPLEKTGLWADCIASGEPMIQNGYQKNAVINGHDGEQIHVARFISVPLYDKGSMVAIIGVGNKKEPYSGFDAQQLTILGQSILRLILRQRSVQEKQMLQSRLQQAYKMEAIGTLAGGIAHDFNNILGIIHGNADMAMDDIEEGNPARRSLDRILQASARAKEIIKQILVFSRQADMHLSIFRPCELIQESLQLLRSTVPTTVKINEELCVDGYSIKADKAQFQQLLMNLFVNAVHAMDEKGTITVSGQRVDLDESLLQEHDGLKPGPFFRMDVSDTGIGIDRETLSKIFDPFFTTKNITEGTGMGLSIVSGIVENHGGMIRVESEPGHGTTFQIYFPLSFDRETAQDGSPPEAIRGSGRILFVDDEEMITEMGAHILERLGYQVTATTSSTGALELFRANPDRFDLVITDQTMPDLSGTELSEQLLKIKPGLPIILCTGFSKSVNRNKAFEIGIKEFLYKPLDKKVLSATISRVLNME